MDSTEPSRNSPQRLGKFDFLVGDVSIVSRITRSESLMSLERFGLVFVNIPKI